ncbi:AP2 domain-containing protein [Lentilactobacillus buchneri]|uniref:AP2 domain-containing protein n=1 Tax=Lentilactobacillus buchneri TaxID=1581 RepID=UPI0021A28AE0|nr:AP2 domain-containing protein [Lentilactobacillus buchneri]
MSKLIDLTGKRFGRLVVLKRGPNQGEQPMWLCKCDCGNQTEAQGINLQSGYIRSCGCLRRDRLVAKYARDGTMLDQIADTRKINKNNKSGIKGVSWDNGRNKWRAYIRIKRKAISLGYFTNKADAIVARKEAEEKYFKPILEKHDFKAKTEAKS